MDKLATIERSILIGEIGEISSTLQTKLDEKIKIALDLKWNGKAYFANPNNLTQFVLMDFMKLRTSRVK